MSVATDTIAALDAAIKRFGTYQLHDKGAPEVLDTYKIALRLSHAGIEPTIETLRTLSEHEDGEPLIHWLIAYFVEDEFWPELTDALVADPDLRARYVPWLAP